MKHTLLVLAFAFAATFSAQAQDSSSEFKPVAGDKTAEVGFNLSNGVFLNGGQLKFRKFTSDNNAFRLGASFSLDNYSPQKDVTSTNGLISLRPGIERHFNGTARISPYIGAELPLSYSFSSYEDPSRKVSGARNDLGGNRGYVGIGLNAVAGVDLYLVKNFYVGFEFGAGVSYQKLSDIETEFKNSSMLNQTIEGGSIISFNTFTSSGLRLGFVF